MQFYRFLTQHPQSLGPDSCDLLPAPSTPTPYALMSSGQLLSELLTVPALVPVGLTRLSLLLALQQPESSLERSGGVRRTSRPLERPEPPPQRSTRRDELSIRISQVRTQRLQIEGRGCRDRRKDEADRPPPLLRLPQSTSRRLPGTSTPDERRSTTSVSPPITLPPPSLTAGTTEARRQDRPRPSFARVRARTAGR